MGAEQDVVDSDGVLSADNRRAAGNMAHDGHDAAAHSMDSGQANASAREGDTGNQPGVAKGRWGRQVVC